MFYIFENRAFIKCRYFNFNIWYIHSIKSFQTGKSLLVFLNGKLEQNFWRIDKEWILTWNFFCCWPPNFCIGRYVSSKFKLEPISQSELHQKLLKVFRVPKLIDFMKSFQIHTGLFLILLKVRKFQNENMESSHCQRYTYRVLQTIQMKLKLLCKEEIS